MVIKTSYSYTGPVPELNDEQIEIKQALYDDIYHLSETIGDRNVLRYKQLTKAADYIESRLASSGYYVKRQNFTVDDKICTNLYAQITGQTEPDKIIVIGAHYDSIYSCPAANDNGTGVASTLVIADILKDFMPDYTIQFVLFVNEEPPYFQTHEMGSYVYAKKCRQENKNIIAAISLETIGYYTQRKNSQHYPFPFNLVYPSTGNFIAFVSDLYSKPILDQALKAFQKHCDFPAQAGAVPRRIQGAGWSDHWSFWQFDYPAIMITDTAYFRYPYYHKPDDTIDKINFESYTVVTCGIEKMLREMAKIQPKKSLFKLKK